MKRMLALLLALSALCLGGCREDETLDRLLSHTTTSPSSTATPEQTTTTPPVTTAPTKTATVTVGYAPPQGATPSCDVSGGDAQAVDVMLWTDRAVTDFRVVRVAYDVDGGNEKIGAVLHEVGDLRPEDDAFILRMTFVGLMPSTGIAYTDANGRERFFGITMSGRDGRLLLTDLTPVTLTMTADKITPTGLSLTVSATGGQTLTYGKAYWIEIMREDGWQRVSYLGDIVSWESIGILLPANTTQKLELDWTTLYGTLGVGKYRLGKEFSGKTCYAEFEIK